MSDDTLRSIDLSRTGEGRYRATNARGGVLPFGSGDDSDFTPVELLLAAIAGCSAINVDLITGRRAEPLSFAVHAAGDKIRDELGNRLTDIRVSFDVVFPEGEAGDRAREMLPRAIEQTRDRLCTVSRTVEVGTPMAYDASAAPGAVGAGDLSQEISPDPSHDPSHDLSQDPA